MNGNRSLKKLSGFLVVVVVGVGAVKEKNGGSTKISIFSFRLHGSKYIATEVGHFKFGMKINHIHTYKTLYIR